MKSAGALPFPLQLYDMLEDAERCGFDHIIAWIPNGAGFRVHMPDDLVKNILPRYLNQQTKYKSFQRQLNMYEFKMLRKAPKGSNKEMYKGAIFHPMFIRGKREVCNMILRKSIMVHMNTTPSTTKKRRATTSSRKTPCTMVGDSSKKEDDKKFSPSTQQLSRSNPSKENGSISCSNTSAVEQVKEKTSSSMSSSTTASSSQDMIVETCMKVSVTNSFESTTTTNTSSTPTCDREVKSILSSYSTKNYKKQKAATITLVPTSNSISGGVAAMPRSITLTKNAFCEEDSFVLAPSAGLQFGGIPPEAAVDQSAGTGIINLGSSGSNSYYCTGYHLGSSSTYPTQHQQDIERRKAITNSRIPNFGRGTLDDGRITCSNTTMQQKETYHRGIDPSYPTTILKFPLSNCGSVVPFNNTQATPWARPAAWKLDRQMEAHQDPCYHYTDSTIFLTVPSHPEKYQQYGSNSSAATSGDSKHVSSALAVVSLPPQSISALSSTTTAASSSSSSLSSYASSSSTLDSSYSDFYFSKSSLNHSHEQEEESGRLEGFTSNNTNMFRPMPTNGIETTQHIGTTTAAITGMEIETHKDYIDEDPATTWDELIIFGYDGSYYDHVLYDTMHPIEDDDITREIISAFDIDIVQ